MYEAPGTRMGREREIAQLAYSLLYDEIGKEYILDVTYSRRFKPYNANVRKRGRNVIFSLSHSWRTVSPEIVIGLLQHLLLKLEGDHHRSTINIDLYNNFVKRLDRTGGDKEHDPLLKSIFDEVNARYFEGTLDAPSLIFKGTGRRTLATYNYHDDTIRVSEVFRGAPRRILAFLIYHESLHKLLKYEERGQRNHHHTSRFRRMEKLFEDYEAIDAEIGRYLKRTRF